MRRGRDRRAGCTPVALYVLASSVTAALALVGARETYRVPLAGLDGATTGRFTRAESEPALAVDRM